MPTCERNMRLMTRPAKYGDSRAEIAHTPGRRHAAINLKMKRHHNQAVALLPQARLID